MDERSRGTLGLREVLGLKGKRRTRRRSPAAL
jgi:hypothetical protein